MEKPGVTPRRRYRPPAYPTQRAVLARPELLRRHIPKPWLAQREIVAVAGTLLALDATGCTRTPSPLAAAALVAPIFEHGRGRVGIGCVAVTPPALLSEDEALQIMREELDRNGLAMTQQNVPLDSVIIVGQTRVDGYEWVRGATGSGWVSARQPLEVDLLDPERRVAVEFISRADFYPLGGTANEWAGAMDFTAVARSVSKQVQRRAHGLYFGAFYEPAVGRWESKPLDELQAAVAASQDPAERQRAEAELQRAQDERHDWDQTVQAARERTAEQLRAQVKDFVDWLKAQGAV